MSLPVITIESLGKKYHLTHKTERPRYTTLRDVIANKAKRAFRRHSNRDRKGVARTEEFWALKDVSLEINEGEVVGIIGRNGAGKSTLLKILSRITEPTAGRVRIRGRVASLLEVGTGFHPELTGRENIYLNGAILGMARAEISRKFDEIVAFAEVEQFLDTPIKHYSSGMYVRLAFAVAAHLEPEIFVVDEVLAVGDLRFQKKCLGKMGDVARDGRTVLFVSHNMATVQMLCSQGILLSGGRVHSVGGTTDVISEYLSCLEATGTDLQTRTDRQGDQSVRIVRMTLYPVDGQPGDGIRVGEEALLEITYDNPFGHVVSQLAIAVGIYDSLGRAISFLENLPLQRDLCVTRASGVIRCRLSRLPLVPGSYYLNIHIKDQGHLLDWIQQAHRFMVYEGDFFGTGKLTYAALGGVYLDHDWEQD